MSPIELSVQRYGPRDWAVVSTFSGPGHLSNAVLARFPWKTEAIEYMNRINYEAEQRAELEDAEYPNGGIEMDNLRGQQ